MARAGDAAAFAVCGRRRCATDEEGALESHSGLTIEGEVAVEGRERWGLRKRAVRGD